MTGPKYYKNIGIHITPSIETFSINVSIQHLHTQKVLHILQVNFPN